MYIFTPALHRTNVLNICRQEKKEPINRICRHNSSGQRIDGTRHSFSRSARPLFTSDLVLSKFIHFWCYLCCALWFPLLLSASYFLYRLLYCNLYTRSKCCL